MEATRQIDSRRKAHIIRMPHSPSYRIPLFIKHPNELELISWCYVADNSPAIAPSGFLIVEHEGNIQDCNVVVKSNFGDYVVQASLVMPEDIVRENDKRAIIEILLLSFSPSRLESLSELLMQFKSILDTIASDDTAPTLAISQNGRSLKFGGGTKVPSHLVGRINGTYHYIKVDNIEVKIGTVREIVLDCSSNTHAISEIDRAIAVFDTSYLLTEIVGY